MSHHCMQQSLTEIEEERVTKWLLDAAKTRPKDWEFDGYTARDRVSGMNVWVATGAAQVFLWAPSRTGEFRPENAKRIFEALHKVRHMSLPGSNPQFEALQKAMDKAPMSKPKPDLEQIFEIEQARPPQLEPPKPKKRTLFGSFLQRQAA